MTYELTPNTIFVFTLILTRLGTMLMLLPAIGESMIPARTRLAVGFGMTAVIFPLVQDQFPVIPVGITALIVLLGGELIVGLFVGGTARLVMSTLQYAGAVIAFQTGLAFAQNYDPTQGVQAALLGSFLSVLGVTMVFSMDLHHLMIMAMHDSYELFRPGQLIPLGIALDLVIDIIAKSFVVSLQLSAPFIIFGLIFYIGLGVLSKLMPQVQVFFVAMPANIGIGLLLFFLMLSVMMFWFAEYFVEATAVFLV